MSRQTWHRPPTTLQDGRDATRARVIEAIDRAAPGTKARLAEQLDLSEQYCSEILSDLKADGIVRKGYVVDDGALYETVENVSELLDADADADTASPPLSVMALLDRLERVTTRQYDAAAAAVLGESVEHAAEDLESIANQRWSAVVDELKSHTLTTDWPGNRVAADLATVATDLELVGDRAGIIAATAERDEIDVSGVVAERITDIFDAGREINDEFRSICFDGDLAAHDRLQKTEASVHRDLNELFELVTAYGPEVYGTLVTITRALERAIYYWVDAAELAVQLHSGRRPAHASL